VGLDGVRFVKGHGTRNDFVVLPDPDGTLSLDAAAIRAICDRRAGIGGDGVLRVVRTAAEPDAAADAGAADWFMDYRNADGSVAEMCGNGIRVFARYLVEAGLAAPGELAVATRDGVKTVRVPAAGDVTVDMGRWAPIEGAFTVTVGTRHWPATGVSMGNPHAVAGVGTLDDAGPLCEVPDVVPVFPAGVNVEFVVERGRGHLAMRVHERGVGETQSCGTGACAAAVAVSERRGDPLPATYDVDVPGGRLTITVDADRRVLLSGPAVLVADGVLRG
jgi:diaminopimelate epimerase